MTKEEIINYMKAIARSNKHHNFSKLEMLDFFSKVLDYIDA